MKESEDIRGLKIALGVYLVVLAMKLGVYFMTGVMALMAEALHSLSDIFISAFLLVAALWSRKQADQVHMYGYGRAQNVAALVASVLFISFTSFRLYEEAIPRLFEAHLATYQNLPLAIGVLVVSMIISAAPLINIWRQKERGPAAKAQLMECLNDEMGLFAALAGTVLILFGLPIADPIASILVATLIALNAIGLFRENMSFLLGRAPDRQDMQKIEKETLTVPGVLEVHGLRGEYIGPDDLHIEMHIRVARGTTVEEGDMISKVVRERIKEIADPRFCVVHVDPALLTPLPASSPTS